MTSWRIISAHDGTLKLLGHPGGNKGVSLTDTVTHDKTKCGCGTCTAYRMKEYSPYCKRTTVLKANCFCSECNKERSLRAELAKAQQTPEPKHHTMAKIIEETKLYVASSDFDVNPSLEGPSHIQVLCECGCVVGYEVLGGGKLLSDGEMSEECVNGLCIFSLEDATVAAYSYLAEGGWNE